METKKCTKCFVEKHISEFRVRRNKYGEYLNSQCKYCENHRYNHICQQCENHYSNKNKNSKYCSKQCASDALRKKITYKCENCGKEHSVKPFLYNKSVHHYCSDKCHREHKTTWYKGSLIYNFNPNRTHEQRRKERKTNEDAVFVNGVKKRDNYTCACCKQRGGVLVSHHINSYNCYPDGRYDIDNGITLCQKCHLDFHKKYGFGNNNEQQLEDFISNYYKVIPSRA